MKTNPVCVTILYYSRIMVVLIAYKNMVKDNYLISLLNYNGDEMKLAGQKETYVFVF